MHSDRLLERFDGQTPSPAGRPRVHGSRLREPGLWRIDPGLERYRVPGGGAIAFPLEPGDQLSITDCEGRQRCELVLFDEQGRPDPGAVGLKSRVAARGLQDLLANGGSQMGSLAAHLRRRGIDPAGAHAIELFGGDSHPGEQTRFSVQRNAFCVIVAPGGNMPIDRSEPPTDLLAQVVRTKIRNTGAPDLPEPLAEPRLDLHIDRMTAIAYEVRAGEFIQIIDIGGRQCSDFQAFARRQLDRGVERSLDATTTRTLMGAAYPGPGLFSKFFDQDMRPLVEVVRDTVGRHDTFALACTAKYYEDIGYFGHPNCTENFNAALHPFGVAPRKGWPAINFFYNTAIDANNVLYSDEPWSRPGDYVLLRAVDEVVCATSACPDDTSPANAWNPTDIHVRVYPARNTFTRAVAYRMTPDADPKLTRETGFHPRTSCLTRKFAEYRGYWLPTSFTQHGAVEEYFACRERATIIDLSPLRKFEILGPDAEELLQRALTRDVRRLSVGQVVYSAMCYETGGMIDDGTLFRLGANNFRWIGGDDYGGIWLRELAEKLGLRVWVKSSTDQIHNVALQGPLSRDILKEIVKTSPTQPTIEELAWFRFCVGRIPGDPDIPVMVSRTGYSGELGYEIWCHPDHASAVWDSISESGRPHKLVPMGLEALDILRIEAGLIFAGQEFCDQTDPFEAGIGFTVALETKKDDFVGKEALLRRAKQPQRKLVGLELSGNEPTGHGDSVHAGRAQVGVVTSGTRSPVLSKNIALCRIDIAFSKTGTTVEVGKLDGQQKRLPATVATLPFYDPGKTRVRS